jgi:hypothetical protein
MIKFFMYYELVITRKKSVMVYLMYYSRICLEKLETQNRILFKNLTVTYTLKNSQSFMVGPTSRLITFSQQLDDGSHRVRWIQFIHFYLMPGLISYTGQPNCPFASAHPARDLQNFLNLCFRPLSIIKTRLILARWEAAVSLRFESNVLCRSEKKRPFPPSNLSHARSAAICFR